MSIAANSCCHCIIVRSTVSLSYVLFLIHKQALFRDNYVAPFSVVHQLFIKRYLDTWFNRKWDQLNETNWLRLWNKFFKDAASSISLVLIGAPKIAHAIQLKVLVLVLQWETNEIKNCQLERRTHTHITRLWKIIPASGCSCWARGRHLKAMKSWDLNMHTA